MNITLVFTHINTSFILLMDDDCSLILCTMKPWLTLYFLNSTHYPTCTDTSKYNTAGIGGCSAGCYCDAKSSGNGIGVCDNSSGSCGTRCANDNDCGAGYACAIGGQFKNCNDNGSTCVPYNDCSSTVTSSKRSLFGINFDLNERVGRMKRSPYVDIEKRRRGPAGT